MAINWTAVQDSLRTWFVNASGIPNASVIFYDQHAPEPNPPWATILVRPPRMVGGGPDELRWASANSWSAATAYALGARAINGLNLYQCSAAGSSAITAPAWAATTSYLLGAQVVNGAKVYQCAQSGTSAGSGGPTGTGTGIVDGSCKWNYLSPTGGPTGASVGIADGSCVWAYVSVALGNELLPTVVGQREFIVSFQVYASAVTGSGTALEYLTAAQTSFAFPSTQAAFAVAATPFCFVGSNQPVDLTALVSTQFQSRASMDVRFRVVDSANDVPIGYIATVVVTPTYSF